MAYEKAATVDDVWSGEMRGVVVAGRKVLLVNVEGCLFAYEDRCAHQAVALSAGRLDGAVLTCSAHEWQYDVCTGRGINPDNVRLRAYAVTVRGGDVLVDVSASPSEERP